MRPSPNSVMIFAAGLGTRMGALVRDRPKPLVTVAGRALLDHALALADDAAIPRKVVNLHYLGAQIRTHLATRPDVALSDESTQLLDTGGGLRAAAHLLGGPAAFTLNSDTVWSGPNPLPLLARRWQEGRARAILAVAPLAAVRGRLGGGDFALDGAGRITGWGGDWVYLGAQVLDLDCLQGMPAGPFSLRLVWERLIAEGAAEAVVHHGGWCDVGHPGGIAEAEAMLRGPNP